MEVEEVEVEEVAGRYQEESGVDVVGVVGVAGDDR